MKISARDVQVNGGGGSQGARRNVGMEAFRQIWRSTIVPQTLPTDLSRDTTDRLLLSTLSIAIYYYYSARNQSINQSKRIYIAPYVAGESEARVGLG